MITRLPIALLAVVLGVALAGCGDDSSGGSAGGSADTGVNDPYGYGSAQPTSTAESTTTSESATTTAGDEAEVEIEDFAFAPASLTVKAGTKVKFKQRDDAAHTATASGSGGFDTGTLDKGQEKLVAVTKAGTYDYICTIHPSMKGKLVVTS